MSEHDDRVARGVARARELYDRHRFGDFCYGQQRDRHNRPLMEFLRGVPAQSDVYDIGCGTGYWIDAAVRLGVAKERILALDLSPTNAATLRRRGFKSLCGDVLALPFSDHVADVTICNGVIHHTPDPLRAFLEIVRITKPGGLIFFGAYNRWNPYFYLVHRAAAPLRYIYWNWTRRILDVVYPVAAIVFQPLARIVIGRFLDVRTGKTMLADQIMTPYAHLFSRRKVRQYARHAGCTVLSFGHSGAHMLLTAVLRVDKGA